MNKLLWPIGQRIIVKKLSNEQSSGGVFIPKQVQQRSLMGTVIHVGPEAKDIVSENDVVVFAQYSGTAFKPYMDDKLFRDYEDCIIMNAEDILCVVTGMNQSAEITEIDVGKIIA
jgi:co-chaperonin GroES (HSP10)